MAASERHDRALPTLGRRNCAQTRRRRADIRATHCARCIGCKRGVATQADVLTRHQFSVSVR